VICAECQTDLVTTGQYCKCCADKLSLHKGSALEAAPLTTVETGQGKASVARCGSCGGPPPDGDSDLCRSCQQAFGSLLGGGTPVTTPEGDSVSACAEVRPLEASPSSELVSCSPSPSTRAAASTPEITVPPSMVREMAQSSSDSEAAKSGRAHPSSPPRPAVVSKRSIAAVPSHRGSRAIIFAAAASVTVAAIGVAPAARWLGVQGFMQAAREGQPEQPTTVAENVTVARRPAMPGRTVSAAETATNSREPTVAPSKPLATARPKPTTAVRPSGDLTNPSAQQTASVLASTPTMEPLAPVVAPPPAVPVAAEPRAIAREAPGGRLFEPTDVDESPQIATRVEPQLPDDLPVLLRSDIVVVRVLVSQTGHPFRVNLLRRSKVGRSLDDAVVAAVTQWTFSPARKRGEAVSCWYNIGVPLGPTN